MEEDISIDEPSPQELYQDGLKAYREKDYQNALSYFNQALEQDPRYESALNARGVVLHSLGRYSEAMRDFNLVLSINPANEKANYNLEKTQAKIRNISELLPHQPISRNNTRFGSIIIILIAILTVSSGVILLLNYTAKTSNQDKEFLDTISEAINEIKPLASDISNNIDETNLNKLKVSESKLSDTTNKYKNKISSFKISNKYQSLRETFLEVLDHYNKNANFMSLSIDNYNIDKATVAMVYLHAAESESKSADEDLEIFNTQVEQLGKDVN